MAAPDDGKHDRVTTPPGRDETPTPVRPFETGPAVSETTLGDSVLRALGARYDILKELGRGGMGVVFQARDRETDEVVALKVLKPEIARNAEYVERFKAELRLARKITHKNVCRTYELLRFGEAVCIGMEYVEGESLRSLLRRLGSVPLRRGIEWVRQIGAALAEAHSQGVVHRDLKPENILIDRDGNARVLDFGIARSIEADHTQTGSVLGTPAYMSPEQAEGKPADHRSDIYSLGLMLYEMFVGRPVFQADTAVTLALKQIHETPEPPRAVEPYLPAFLERVILRCLQKTPNRRYASISDLLADLSEQEAPAEAASRPLPTHLLTGRRADLPLALAGAAGLVAFLVLAPRVSVDSDLRIRVTRSMLLDKAQEEIRARGWSLGAAPYLNLGRDRSMYEFLAERVGYAEAKRRTAQDLPPYRYEVRFPAREDRTRQAKLSFELDGSLRSVEMPLVGWVPQGEGLPEPQARERAEAEVQRVFGVSTATLEPEQAGALSDQGRRGHSFIWARRDTTGITRRYQVNIFDRVALLKRWDTLPEDYRPRRPLPAATALILGWLLVPFLLFVARRLFLQLRFREVMCLAALAAAGAIGLTGGNAGQELAQYLVGLFFFIIVLTSVFVVLSASTVYVAQRRWPHLTSTYEALLDMRAEAAPVALGLVRGAAGGLAVLAAYAVALQLGTATGLTWPTLHAQQLDLASPILPIALFGVLLCQTSFFAFFLGFALGLARRFTTSSPLLVAAGGILYAVSTFASQWPVHAYDVLIAFIVGAGFSLILIRFDLVTLMAAAFTFDLWQDLFRLTRMFEPVGAGSIWALFVLWSAALAGALFAGFRPQWGRLKQKFAGLID